jgi:hypothetical protein
MDKVTNYHLHTLFIYLCTHTNSYLVRHYWNCPLASKRKIIIAENCCSPKLHSQLFEFNLTWWRYNTSRRYRWVLGYGYIGPVSDPTNRKKNKTVCIIGNGHIRRPYPTYLQIGHVGFKTNL